MRKYGVVAELGLLLCLTVPLAGAAWAAALPIYACTDANGKKLTSDRPIAECANRDQKLLNSDGSVRKVVPPTPTADERAEAEAAERRAAAERKPLLDEAEFYAGRTLPPKLRQALDANDAALEAQRTLVQNQQSEVVRINSLFDVELERLKRLWGGAVPGSMGVLATAPTAALVASAPRKAASK